MKAECIDGGASILPGLLCSFLEINISRQHLLEKLKVIFLDVKCLLVIDSFHLNSIELHLPTLLTIYQNEFKKKKVWLDGPVIFTTSLGLLFGPVGTFSIFLSVSIPSMTFPNTTCFPSKKSHFAVVIKNFLRDMRNGLNRREPEGAHLTAIGISPRIGLDEFFKLILRELAHPSLKRH
jgi:hypothetical protein